MKKIIALCAALALSDVMMVPAAAANPPTTNKGANTTIAYNVSYADPYFGPVSCTGVRQYGKNWPGTATTGGRDSFTCTSTSGLPLTNLTPNESMSLTGTSGWVVPYGWTGDFIPVAATTFTGTVSSDGFSCTAVAGYY
jgi:hypothetical protein